MVRSVLTLLGVAALMTWAGLPHVLSQVSATYPGVTVITMAAQGDAPATHNMLVVGEETVYLSHLPMFQEALDRPMPHRYQAIFEVTFAGQGGNPQRDYANDRKLHPGTKVYTLNPEPFALPSLSGPAPSRDRFGAKVFRGHLEKLREGEGVILPEIEVRVARVVHFREFAPNAAKPNRLEYLFFGKGDDLFLAHVITKTPDFDQVLKVKVVGPRPAADALAAGVRVVFPGTVNDPASRLKVRGRASGQTDAPAPEPIQVDLISELYFEEGELRLPPDFRQTREEQRAGMP
jgi:hypothetical protein